jgi:6-phosphogluconate dehydrogenase
MKSPAEFVSSIKRPRRIIMLVMAGKPVDDTIALLAAHMDEGDVLVDGGNEWFPNSVRRAEELAPRGIHFVGMGVSGGEEGARNGPSLMPGGPRVAFDLLEPILVKCAAQVDDGACTTYCGPIGAGNYVKMVTSPPTNFGFLCRLVIMWSFFVGIFLLFFFFLMGG